MDSIKSHKELGIAQVYCASSHRIHSKCLQCRCLRLTEPRQVVQGQRLRIGELGCISSLSVFSIRPFTHSDQMPLYNQVSFSDVCIKYF